MLITNHQPLTTNHCSPLKTLGPLSSFDLSLLAGKTKFLIGVDEAGRGPLAGPVVACAAHIPPPVFPLVSPFINDSKKLTPKKREAAFSAMLRAGVRFGFGWATPEEIDRCNILEATFNAMGAAVRRLVGAANVEMTAAGRGLSLRRAGNPPVVSPHTLRMCGAPHPLSGYRASPCPPSSFPILVLVDGPHRIKRLELPQQTVVNGDARSLCIAAASIFAKVLRDRWMERLERRYPGYALGGHKGYGTAAHLAALKALGPSPVHRRSFAPVADCSAVTRSGCHAVKPCYERQG